MEPVASSRGWRGITSLALPAMLMATSAGDQLCSLAHRKMAVPSRIM